MNAKITTCLVAAALMTSAGFVSAPASAQGNSAALNARNSVAKDQSRIAIRKSDRQQYSAGVRAGLDRTGVNVRASYNRGYRDGSYVRAQEPRAYQAYPYAVYRNSVDPRTDERSYARYDGGYEPGYRPYARYDAGLNPITALLGIASMPLAAVTSSSRSGQENFANWVAYCSARYGSFDPASGTFLADDGNRYYCS